MPASIRSWSLTPVIPPRLWWVALPLLAYALRVAGLAGLGDLEFDEVVSVWYAGHPVPAMLATLARALFEHPPLYYLTLRSWLLAVGDGPVALPQLAMLGNPAGWGSPEALPRWLSVLPGTLLVPLMVVAGRQVGHMQAGWVAAGAIALAPLHIFYSREARMYELVAMLTACSLVLLLRACAGGGVLRWAAYVAAASAATSSHYLAATALIAHAIYVWRRRQQSPAAWRAWRISATAVAAALLIWLTNASGVRESLPAFAVSHLSLRRAGELVGQAWLEFAAGPEEVIGPGPLPFLGAVGLVMLFLTGLVATALRREDAVWILGASVAAPLAGIALLLAIDKPFQSRYLLLATPAYYLLAAIGGHSLWSASGGRSSIANERPVGPLSGAATSTIAKARLVSRAVVAVCVGALLVAWAAFALAYYGGYQRADYGALTRRIAAYARAGDGIVLAGPWQFWYFRYYYRGDTPYHLLPREAPPPASRREVQARLQDLSSHHRRLWVSFAGLAQSDPEHDVERWLLANAWEGERLAYRTAVLGLYRLDTGGLADLGERVVFGDRLEVTAAADASWVPSGDVARFVLHFRARGQLQGLYRASLRLVGVDGQEVRKDFDIADGVPADRPPVWSPGTALRLRRGLWLPPGLGTGTYRIQLLVYPAGAPEAPLRPDRPDPSLPTAAQLGTILVTVPGAPLSLDPLQGFTPSQTTLGDPAWNEYFAVVGYRLEQQVARPGHQLAVTLAWLASRRPEVDHQITLELRDAAERVVARRTGHAVAGTLPTTLWRRGEVVQDRRALDLGPELEDGDYRLWLRMVSGSGTVLRQPGSGADHIQLATVRVQRPQIGGRLSWLDARLPAPLQAAARRLLVPIVQRWFP